MAWSTGRKGRGEQRRHFAVAPKELRTDAQGRVHDSKSEMIRFKELELQQSVGIIRDLKRQVPFAMIVNGIRIRQAWKADFTYQEFIDGEWRLVVEDNGAIDARHSRMTRNLMKALYNIDVRLTQAR